MRGLLNREKYLSDILSFAREAAEHNVLISFRLWNLNKDDATDEEKRRNRETLEVLEKEFNLDYKIEEKVIPGSGVKIANRIYLNQDYEFQWPVYRHQRMMVKDFAMRFAVKQPFL